MYLIKVKSGVAQKKKKRNKCSLVFVVWAKYIIILSVFSNHTGSIYCRSISVQINIKLNIQW